jgi:hypothetical protein
MGYKIELSFNIKINNNVTELLEEITIIAKQYNCKYIFDDYEFDERSQFSRNHCIITLHFANENVSNMIEFLSKIKKISYIFTELIYNETNNSLLYASQYYITQKMDKYIAKQFQMEKKERNYTEEEIQILNAVCYM